MSFQSHIGSVTEETFTWFTQNKDHHFGWHWSLHSRWCPLQLLPVYGAETVNINRADVSTLASQLVGVGPQLAKRIVEFRERYGAFKSLEALSDVRGIGTVLLEKNEQRIVLE
jgi:competence ComEA-like helix-hairpin-helix protein